MTYTDCMTDCETFGLTPAHAILSVAFVFFNADSPALSYAHECWNVDLATEVERGALIDRETVKWWQDPSRAAAFDRLQNPRPEPAKCVIYNIDDFWQAHAAENCRIWGHGASADIPWLEGFFARHHGNVKTPWHYQNIRDTRTLFEQAALRKWKRAEWPTNRIQHYAADDAIQQAKDVQGAWDAIN